MVKSGNHYDSRTSGSFKPDIEQIQIVLKFLMPNLDLEITGKFDTDTEEAIYNYQEEQNIEANGIADRDTLEEMLYDLKANSFDDVDLSHFLKSLNLDSEINLMNGKVEIPTAATKICNWLYWIPTH